MPCGEVAQRAPLADPAPDGRLPQLGASTLPANAATVIKC